MQHLAMFVACSPVVNRKPLRSVVLGCGKPSLAEHTVDDISRHSECSFNAVAHRLLTARFLNRRNAVSTRVTTQPLKIPSHFLNMLHRSCSLIGTFKRRVRLRDGHSTVSSESDASKQREGAQPGVRTIASQWTEMIIRPPANEAFDVCGSGAQSEFENGCACGGTVLFKVGRGVWLQGEGLKRIAECMRGGRHRCTGHEGWGQVCCEYIVGSFG